MKYIRFSLLIIGIGLILYNCFLLPLPESEYDKLKNSNSPNNSPRTSPSLSPSPSIVPTASPEEPATFNFAYKKAAIDSNENIYFIDGTNKGITQWNNGIINSILNYSSNILKIEVYNQKLFIAEGKNLWIYDLLLKTNTRVYIADGTILNIYLFDNYLVCNENIGAWTTFSMIRLTDYVKTDSKEWRHSSATYAYDSNSKKIFLLRDGTSPDDICFQKIDLLNEKLLEYGDSPYHGDYYFGHPLKLFPDNSKIVSSMGQVFLTDTLLYDSYINYKYCDLDFYNNQIIVLTENSHLVKLNISNPYTLINTIGEYNYSPKKLFIVNNTAYIILENNSKIYIRRVSLE